ncbi:hypothetical protein [Pseudarthrobacter sulfonivorans]|uniref:hypothetical protein n=1 Tax=Pseudarthrobacter sulfonivorans TaxID=121292 RepID=UPI0028544415|nr:hypothetical protein [Pseudarthrobacter sulfonivorans]MDR6414098.1 hypothetical protein [Pseudarthrobacter sulfonivorans]
MARPKDWDEKYGPWGTPPDYTPAFTVMTNMSPTGVRVGGVVSAIFVMVGLCSYKTWWCFHLARRRAEWLKERKAKAIQNGKKAQA